MSTTVPGQKWKLVSRVIHRLLVSLTYLVRVGEIIRYCHADHLLALSATLLEQDPILQPLDLSSPFIKKPVENDLPVPLACSGQPVKKPGEPSVKEARDKFEKPFAESGNEKPEMLNQPSEIPERQYSVRIRNWTCKSFVIILDIARTMTVLSPKLL